MALGTKAEMRGMTRGAAAEKVRYTPLGREIPLCQTNTSIEAVIPAEDINRFAMPLEAGS
jgi:hypothetical protein